MQTQDSYDPQKLDQMDPGMVLDLARNQVSVTIKKVQDFLQNKQHVSISNKEYMQCYNLVLKASDRGASPTDGYQQQKNSIPIEDELFKFYRRLLEDYLELDYIKISAQGDPENYLSILNQQFENFKIYIRWLWKMFQYLDRFYLKNKSTDLYTEGFKTFREKYWNLLSDQVFKLVRDLHIERLRNDIAIPQEDVRHAIACFTYMGFSKKAKLEKEGLDYTLQTDEKQHPKYYEENFQQKFSRELEQFSLKIVQQWKSFSTPEYVNKALAQLEVEERIADIYYSRSKSNFIKIMEQHIIEEVMESLCNNPNTGVEIMLRNEQDDNLCNIYKLARRVRKTLVHISKKLQVFLEELGSRYNSDSKSSLSDPQMNTQKIALNYIEQCFTLFDKSEHIVRELFQNDLDLSRARDNAFQTFFNQLQKSSLYLALYCDNLMVKGQNEANVEEQQKRIVKVFTYLFNKDQFFKHYQHYFSGRLLNNRSKNSTAENQLITRFKTEVGHNAVHKISTMYNDIQNSEAIVQQIGSTIQQKYKITFNLYLITKSSWPIEVPDKKCIVPDALRECVREFEEFYHRRNVGRTISWLFSQGTAEVAYRADQKRYFMQFSNYQLVIVLLIERTPDITVEQVAQITNISQQDVCFQIIGPIKNQLVKVNGNLTENPRVQPGDKLSLNFAFVNKNPRIDMRSKGKLASQEEERKILQAEQEIEEQLSKEREAVVDGAVVKIMKSRKTMRGEQLIQDVLKMITIFKPTVRQIKRRIETLIERDYLSRDKVEQGIYNYKP